MKGYWANWSKTLGSAMYCIRTDKENWTLDEFFKSGLDDYNNFLKLDEIPDNESVLDIGCGIGRVLFPIQNFYKNLYGIDVSDGMIELANSLKKEYNKSDNIKFIVTDGLGNIPFDSNSISFVFSIICFQHIPSKEVQLKYFSEVDRVLKKNGIAKIMVQDPKYRATDFNCEVGCGISIDEIKGSLVKSGILRTEPSKWICQAERNYWVVIRKYA